ncbi:choline transporter-like protein 4 isoform X1 [Arapaima gigas]
MGGKAEESSPAEYGEPSKYDPSFNGPIHKRSCTDIICCILFMAAIAGYMVVGIMAWLYGDPRHVLYPRNSTGMFCGVGLNQGKPNVLYFDLLKCATTTNIMAAALNGLQCPTTQVCVAQCPSTFWILNPAAYLPQAKPAQYFQQQYCVPSFDLSTSSLSAQEIVNKQLCPAFYIPTASVLGRCLPSVGSLDAIPNNFTLPGMSSTNDTASALKNATGQGVLNKDVLSGFNAKQIGVKIFEDFASSWYWILM